MTRRDYNALAAAISRLEVCDATRLRVARSVAGVCISMDPNDRFDLQRFMEACGVYDES